MCRIDKNESSQRQTLFLSTLILSVHSSHHRRKTCCCRFHFNVAFLLAPCSFESAHLESALLHGPRQVSIFYVADLACAYVFVVFLDGSTLVALVSVHCSTLLCSCWILRSFREQSPTEQLLSFASHQAEMFCVLDWYDCM